MLNLIFPQITFFISCLISISCNAQPDNISFGHLKRIQIKGDEQDNIAALVGEHRYIKLETRAECLISSIDKISYKSGKFFILDLKEQNLFIFNKEGKFITKIGRLGRGPGEYTHLMDFDVDRLGNIYLLDLHQKAILKFNKDGEFLEKDQKNYYICNIAVIDTSTL